MKNVLSLLAIVLISAVMGATVSGLFNKGPVAAVAIRYCGSLVAVDVIHADGSATHVETGGATIDKDAVVAVIKLAPKHLYTEDVCLKPQGTSA